MSRSLNPRSGPPARPERPAGRRPEACGGLRTLLDTDDFSCWEAATASALGQHRSELLEPRRPFQTRFRAGRVEELEVLHLSGRGRLRLQREQVGRGVLWLPLRGLSQERINGETWLAEPGTALLFRPGDALDGETSDEMEGISILIPAALCEAATQPAPPLIMAGPLQQRLLSAARELAEVAAMPPAGACHAAEHFTEALRSWQASWSEPKPRERITARRRRDTVAQARHWMASRLAERCSVAELSRAVGVSTRQLQYSFLQELGRTPMAELRRLRLRRLRSLLLDPGQDGLAVAQLMAAAGLMASGSTAAEYRRWCGESPRRTRLRRRAGG